MPIELAGARGEANVYDTAAVVAWLLEREGRRVRGQSARDEYLRSQTRLNQLKIDEQEGRLVSIAELEPRLIRMVVNMRTRLLQIPDVLADDLAGAVDSAVCRQLLDAAIREALLELAAYKVDADQAGST